MERKALIQRLSELSHCHRDTKLAFGGIFQPLRLEKGQLWGSQGQALPSICFLASGLLHRYRQNPALGQPSHPDHNENQSLHFHLPGEFFTFVHTEQQQADCKIIQPEYLGALTEARLMTTTYPQVQQLLKQQPQAASLLLQLQAEWTQKNLDQLSLLHIEPAIERYQLAAKLLGMHFYQIPQKNLASYLAISRKHLGRLHRELLKRKT